MHAIRTAVAAALEADTLSSPVLASVSSTVLQLDAGEMSKWSVHDVVYHSGTPNDGRTLRITVKDTVNNRLTIEPALDSTPAGGTTIKGGVVEWVFAAGTHIRYDRPRYSAPVGDLLDNATSAALLLYGPTILSNLFQGCDSFHYEMRAISKNGFWAEGLAHRIRRLFDGLPGALTIATSTVQSIEVDDAVLRKRDDELFEWMVPFDIIVAELAA
ncbi:hypothetical protein LCGC14_2001880 [marine sediment metagenome]|uniref:Uncharacterized protein n=1 Tax=marine sediment metagenome TaxID=412755 RepID=A0A0F9HGE2_9ZZZZ